ncbi:sugar transferase [Entomospira nematocerorum]|uniref:Sugar transferase n=1 Tax=Entomospira nematocerorum TaxID=2719987 RepID=A0A968GAP8_9SPIO|nr:sugar transferase [Entomospira nematocera]NIZ46415.1 sugar transferase [Entomospira nematocera]WDI33782.1 sugar transferase [Entomospira nematocera]
MKISCYSVYTVWIKRLLDLLFSLTVLILLSPLFLIIGLAVYCVSPGGSIFYGHKRIGKNHKPFTCWKFRTMVPNAKERLQAILDNDPHLAQEFSQTHKLKKDPRIIKGLGHFLRRMSLDELPQFFNVLLGQMSVIGPRPITEGELIHYGKDAATLLSIRPGISGLWQISGRNDISYARRVSLDLFYIKHITLRLDISIFFKTFRVIILGQGY